MHFEKNQLDQIQNGRLSDHYYKIKYEFSGRMHPEIV